MSLLHSRKMLDTVWHYSVLSSDVLSAKIYFVTFARRDLKKTCMGHRFCGFVTNPVTNIFENVADSKRTKSHTLLNISSSISMNGGFDYE